MRSPSDQRLSHKLDIWKRPWSLISLKIRHFALIRACFGLNSTGSEFRLNPIECNRCFAPRKRFIVFCFPVMTSFLLITFWGQLRAWSLPLGPRFVLDDGSYLIDVSVLSRGLKKNNSLHHWFSMTPSKCSHGPTEELETKIKTCISMWSTNGGHPTHSN